MRLHPQRVKHRRQTVLSLKVKLPIWLRHVLEVLSLVQTITMSSMLICLTLIFLLMLFKNLRLMQGLVPMNF